MTIPRGRRAYNRVSVQAEEEAHDSVASTTLTDVDEDTSVSEAPSAADDSECFPLVIMDPAQRKFEVSVHPEWTVEELKEHGTKIHKVPAASQRLVYRGRMLQDSDTLQEVGLTHPKTIIHLFPKPRVVVSASHSNLGEEEKEDSTTRDGAHIPRIVLDPDEAERRSSILVLGSAEIMEAQNNVKLLSFLLLIICSMELLALFTIMLGVPEATAPDSQDAPPEPSNDDAMNPGNDMEIRTWRNSDYVDLAISTVGFYVATLGIKATTENTMRLAKRYLAGTLVVGTAWIAFYYYLNVDAERRADEERSEKEDNDLPAMSESDYYVQAAFAILLPALVWLLCCVRAWQFHGLLREAEEEAEERIRNEISDVEEGRPEEGDQELTLQNETARIT